MFAGVVTLLAGVAWGQAAPAVIWSPVLEVRHRGITEDADPADAVATQGRVEQRARVGMEVARLGVSARVTFQDVRFWDVASGAVTPKAFAPALADGWVRVEGHLTRNVGAIATVGRQTVVLDEGRILGEDPLSAGSRHLDAVRVVGEVEPVCVEYVHARRFVGEDAPRGYRVQMVRVGARGENPVTTWVADGFWVEDDGPVDTRTSTFGTYLRFDSGRWRGRMDGYLQAGEAGVGSLVGLSAGWVFGPNERLVTHARYDHLSGTNTAAGTAAWSPVLGDSRRFNGLLDRFADPANRPDGLSDAQVVVEARFGPPLSTRLVAHQFRSARDGALYGHELDARAAWSFSPFAALAFEGGWYAPDAATGDAHALFGYVELDATF